MYTCMYFSTLYHGKYEMNSPFKVYTSNQVKPYIYASCTSCTISKHIIYRIACFLVLLFTHHHSIGTSRVRGERRKCYFAIAFMLCSHSQIEFPTRDIMNMSFSRCATPHTVLHEPCSVEWPRTTATRSPLS